MFGLCNELCSENGFGWNLRLKTTHRMLNDPNASEMAKAISPVLARRYHYDAALVDSGREQQKAIVERLRDQLAAQQARGRNYLIGEALSDRKSTRLNSSHSCAPSMPSSARQKNKT